VPTVLVFDHPVAWRPRSSHFLYMYVRGNEKDWSWLIAEFDRWSLCSDDRTQSTPWIIASRLSPRTLRGRRRIGRQTWQMHRLCRSVMRCPRGSDHLQCVTVVFARRIFSAEFGFSATCISQQGITIAELVETHGMYDQQWLRGLRVLRSISVHETSRYPASSAMLATRRGGQAKAPAA
jgi:hypothetical protein